MGSILLALGKSYRTKLYSPYGGLSVIQTLTRICQRQGRSTQFPQPIETDHDLEKRGQVHFPASIEKRGQVHFPKTGSGSLAYVSDSDPVFRAIAADAFGNALGNAQMRHSKQIEGEDPAFTTVTGSVGDIGGLVVPGRMNGPLMDDEYHQSYATNAVPTQEGVIDLGAVTVLPEREDFLFYLQNFAAMQAMMSFRNPVEAAARVSNWSNPPVRLMSAAERTGDVRRGSEIDFAALNQSGPAAIKPRPVRSPSISPVAREPIAAPITSATLNELPAIENLYTPYKGWWETKYEIFTSIADDSSNDWFTRLGGVAGGLLTGIPAMGDMLIGSVYNSGNQASIAGQKWAQGSLLSGDERNIAYMEGGLSFTMGFLGLGDLATLGQAGAMSRAVRTQPMTQEVAREVVANTSGLATQSAQVGKYARRTDISFRPASEVNATFPEGYAPPYKPGTRVTEFTTAADDIYVRVHGESNMARSWMMKREAIEGLSAKEIKAKYALPELPTRMSEVHVPTGTRIRTGVVNPVFGGIGNATQYELLQRLPVTAFRNTVGIW